MTHDFVAADSALSPEQRWVQSALAEPQAVLLHIELTGELDERCLRDAFDRVTAGHDALNQAFLAIPGYRGLRQQAMACNASWETRDMRGSTQEEVGGTVAGAREARFALARAHVLHAMLLRTGEAQWQFVLAASPLVADRNSLETLYAELATAYQSGDAARDEAFQYSQFIEWRQDLEQGEEAQQGRAYWSAHLAQEEATQAPRLSYRREAAPAGLPRKHERTLDPRMVPAATPELTMQAAWWALLARISGRDRFLAGWQHDCRRDYDALAGAVGVFEKILPVAVSLAPDEPFSTWTARLADTIESHRGAQEYWSVDEPPVRAHLEFGFAWASLPSPRGAGLQWRVCELPGPSPLFEMALQVAVHADGTPASVSIHYAPQCYSDAAAARLLDQYLALLTALAQHPAASIAGLCCTSKDEQAALLAMNATAVDCGDLALPARIARWAERTPQAIALEAGSLTLSYAELFERVDRLAHWLVARGVGPERIVALNIERSADLVVALLAVWRAGGAYLPLEPEWPQARRQRILDDAQPILVLHGGAGAAVDGASCAEAWLATIADEVAAMPGTPQGREAQLQHAAYVLYTSGSTGAPKGVVIEHGQLLNYAAGASKAMELGPCRRWALTTTVAADLGNTALFGALLNGACLVIADANDMRDGESFARFMGRSAIDALKIVPSHLEALLEAETPVLPKMLIMGGEATPQALVERIAALAPACRVFNHYGPTETTVGVMVHEVEAAPCGSVLPLTTVLPNCRIYVLDETMALAPTGALGHIYIGGAQVCRGYLKRAPDALFVDDPFQPGERLYRSGDLGCYLPHGGIRLAGRADHQIKVRGFRIEPAEIEAALLRQPGVRQAVLAPITAPQGELELVAFLVADDGCDTEQGRVSLRAALVHDLPAAMLPSRLVFLAQVPRLANGKVDRRALAAHDVAPVAAAIVAPRDDLEFMLHACMSGLLERDSISIHDDFFALGGHSLLAIKLVARIRRLFKLEIPPAAIFDHPSVASLAGAVRVAAPDLAQLELAASACRQQQGRDGGEEHAAHRIGARRLNTHGTGVPLYCFPGVYVDVVEYAPIVAAIAADRPVYGFACHWLGEARWEGLGVEELARHYAAFIRETAGGNRCALLGWSFGGNLAFETARQLDGVIDIQFVGLVDVCQSREPEMYEQFSPQAAVAADADARVQAWLAASPMKPQWDALFARMRGDEMALVRRYLLAMAHSLPADGPDVGSKEYDLWRAFSQHCVMNRYEFKRTGAPLHVWNAGETAKDATLVLRNWLSVGDVRSSEMITGVSHRNITRHRSFLNDLKKRLKTLD